MRKVSDLLSKPLISTGNATFEGVISGFLCDKRLKAVEYLNILVENEALDERKYVALRYVKNIADDSVTITNNLCIKSAEEVDFEKYIDNPVNCRIFDSDGTLIGKVTDVCFGDTTKQITEIKVGADTITPEQIASVSNDIIILYKDGQKPLRKSAPRKVKKPAENTVVAALEEPPVIDGAASEKESAEAAALSEISDAPAENKTDVSEIREIALTELISPEELLLPQAETQSSEGDQAPAQCRQNIMPQRVICNYRFLLGRLVTANIYNMRREPIVKAGSLITAEVVLTAHRNNKLVDLTLHSKA